MMGSTVPSLAGGKTLSQYFQHGGTSLGYKAAIVYSVKCLAINTENLRLAINTD